MDFMKCLMMLKEMNILIRFLLGFRKIETQARLIDV